MPTTVAMTTKPHLCSTWLTFPTIQQITTQLPNLWNKVLFKQKKNFRPCLHAMPDISSHASHAANNDGVASLKCVGQERLGYKSHSNYRSRDPFDHFFFLSALLYFFNIFPSFFFVSLSFTSPRSAHPSWRLLRK